MWKKKETSIEGLYTMAPFISEDCRGNFIKLFEQDTFADLGFPHLINEVFISVSRPGVIRGLHFQVRNPQTKYVSVLCGAIYDVAVDLRTGSPTFGQWHAEELNDRNHKVFCIPAGFAHGFQVLDGHEATVIYQCCGKYDKDSDAGVRWNDPVLAINWPQKESAIISDRDNGLMLFSEFQDIICGLS